MLDDAGFAHGDNEPARATHPDEYAAWNHANANLATTKDVFENVDSTSKREVDDAHETLESLFAEHPELAEHLVDFHTTDPNSRGDADQDPQGR